MTTSVPLTGATDEEMRARPTVLREGLFKDSVVLISGGGSGIGRATAALYARLGASVAICGRDPEKLQSAERFLASLGAPVLAESMSIRDPEKVAALVDHVWDRFGRLDVLVNNAGGQFAQPSIDIRPKGWVAVIDTNLNGTFYMMQAAARRWRDAGRPGSIVSVVASFWRGMPQVAHTCASRAGVVYLTKTLATEWAPLRIRVNCVAPGTIITEGFANYPEAGRASFAQANPMLRSGDPWDVAEAIAYLTSDAAGFVTGETLNVDGGQQNWGDQWFAGRPRYFEHDYAASRLSDPGRAAT